MKKVCALCEKAFDISEKDLAFYDHISPVIGGKKQRIPPPTLCADCRNQRRMAWRNDRSFFKRTCDKTGETIISLYPEKTPFPVFKSDAWWSDAWDPMEYGQEIQWSKSFFQQWQELLHRVPRRSLDLVNCENSDYCNYCGDDKDCYLDIAGEGNQDCYYNLFTKFSKDCMDCTFTYNSTLCYECIQCYDSYNCSYSQYLENCGDCMFCYDLKGCTDCMLSINLRNKKYCFQNEQLTKEEYKKRVLALQLGSHTAVKRTENLWNTVRIQKGIYRDMYMLNCENCSGNNIKNSQNTFNAWNASNCQDCKYLYDVLDAKDCYDLNYSLYNPQASYELISTLQLTFSAFSMATHFSSNVFYCDLCENSSDLFGCIGLNHKQYCIFNKQYTKEEYEEVLPKLIRHMQENHEWGEFFPAGISPHGYNETVAYEYMPLTKEEALHKGFVWNDQKKEQPTVEKIIDATNLPENICDIPDDVLNWAIRCETTGMPFKIIRKELEFYREHTIALPRICPRQRHDNRNALRNPRILWERKCDATGESIHTSYAPSRPEHVYCEKAYLEAVK
ncbi:hypothetical protein CO157_02505 [Candidatus Peregrinibacteria bacterium CG_4_9_14_3_um_filter_49_12]|nr:MAG: hypothetical protein COV83_01085 [Candidatus Peregrinibacteria bacterium CG11_big_fil_rev_8_21_14_0_20_49_14]PJA67860.1 MAG: hypothetical protein CO157_02505 [Candidatus Peregrinibacteria bacterium CG_4_9_14_3_um_filter_49_12]